MPYDPPGDTRPPLERANDLLIEALAILDQERHFAGCYVDSAILKLGLRTETDDASEALEMRLGGVAPDR